MHAIDVGASERFRSIGVVDSREGVGCLIISETVIETQGNIEKVGGKAR